LSDLVQLSASEMATKVQSGEISPVDLVEAHLDRIEKLNPRLNAFSHVDQEGARAAALVSAMRLASEGPRGPLEGVPLSIKSSIAVGGFPWECGSELRRGLLADADAPLVERLKAAGAIILGNTNAPEFLMAWETNNKIYGHTDNPWDLERTAGGSSGGASAAIAARLSAGGFGSDGGGSIRVPAHFTGICGLKPTPGRVPATGHFPASAGPFAALGVVGPMARTVDDVRLLFEVVSGPDDGDPYSAPVPVGAPNPDPEGLKIGFFEDDGRTPVTTETRIAIRRAVAALEEQGFVVEEFRPDNLEEIQRLWWNLFVRAGRLLIEPMIEGRQADLSPTFVQFIEYAREADTLTLDQFMQTLLGRDGLRQHLFAQMQEFPILLCPVGAVQAFRHGEREWRIDGQDVAYIDAWSYTEWFNLTGNPAMAVPVEIAKGLPVGVQLVGRCWEEENVLAVAAKLQEAVGILPAPPME
jgi:Asp-tRNA(Asn)/Glu-tRNA(Gln) amidotransferase A subunit family amidase